MACFSLVKSRKIQRLGLDGKSHTASYFVVLRLLFIENSMFYTIQKICLEMKKKY